VIRVHHGLPRLGLFRGEFRIDLGRVAWLEGNFTFRVRRLPATIFNDQLRELFLEMSPGTRRQAVRRRFHRLNFDDVRQVSGRRPVPAGALFEFHTTTKLRLLLVHGLAVGGRG
jgi:hypothetical protein